MQGLVDARNVYKRRALLLVKSLDLWFSIEVLTDR